MSGHPGTPRPEPPVQPPAGEPPESTAAILEFARLLARQLFDEHHEGGEE